MDKVLYAVKVEGKDKRVKGKTIRQYYQIANAESSKIALDLAKTSFKLEYPNDQVSFYRSEIISEKSLSEI